MKKKAFKFFTAISTVGLAVTLASCTDNQASSTASNTNKNTGTGSSTSTTTKTSEAELNSEVFYCSNPNGEFVFTKIGNKFTLSILGKTFTGSCTVNNNDYTLSASGLNCQAKYVNGQLVVTYENNSYNFYKMTSYNVTFNNGVSSDTYTVLNGKNVEEPVSPKQDGKVFVGWYKDSKFSEVFDFDKEIITSDITLYARFVDLEAGMSEYKVSFVSDEEEVLSTTTINGVLYSLPELESKDGKAFLGWWVSDFNDPNKLTYKYTNQKLPCDTVLYAVWNDGEIHASANLNGVSWDSLGTGKTYNVKVTDPSGVVESSNSQSVNFNYNFSTKAKGVYEIEVSCDGKSSKVYYANKTLSMVSNYQVAGNILLFNPVDNAEGYTLKVEYGDSVYEYDLGDNTYFDFSNCPMQKDGIKFIVTAYSDDLASSTPTVFVLNRVLDKVENVQVKDDVLLWNRVSNAQGYVVGVEKDGETTYYDLGNVTSFSLKEYTGDLKITVYPVTDGYNSPSATYLEYKKTTLACPLNVDVNNLTVSWDEVDGAKSYVVKVGNTEYTSESTEFTLDAEELSSLSKYSVSVMAVANDTKNNSLYSDSVQASFLVLNGLKYSNGTLEWNSVLGAANYGVILNNGKEVSVKNNYYNVLLNKEGVNKLKVVFYDDDGLMHTGSEISVNAYALYFETCTGDDKNTLPTQYFAFGDVLDLPEPTNLGYDFDGWYNIPNGSKNNGKQYTNSSYMQASALVLYANWKAKQYSVSLDCGDGATLDESTANVSYRESFVLPVPFRNSQDMLTFDGWYTGANGTGTKVAGASGESIGVWNFRNDVTLYANWVNALSFEAIKKNNNIVGYKAEPGVDLNSVTELTIPAQYNGLPILELGSFAGCGNLVKINIPNSITYLDTVTGFTSCNSLEAFNVYEVSGYKGEVLYTSYDGVLYYNNQVSDNAGWEVKFVPKKKSGECFVMEGTVNIPLKSFYGSKITSINIPYTVKTIGAEAFYYSYLENVTFDATPSTAKEEALTLENRAFAGCKSLTSITLPRRVTSIATGYEGYSSLSSFDYCDNLTSISVENGNKNYSSYDGVLYNRNKTELLIVPAGKSGDFTVRGGTIRIADYAFMNCKKITSVTISGSVLEIGERAFYYCSKLNKVVFEDENDETLTINEGAFYNCDLSSIVLPHNARVIKSNAFGSNSKLTTVTVNSDGDLSFGNGITADLNSYSYVTKVIVGKTASSFDISGAFGGENNCLTTVEVVSGNVNYSSDEKGILYNASKTTVIFCPNIKDSTLTLPDSVTEISAGCFRNNTKLQSITFGANLTTIGEEAFSGCTNLQNVIFTGASEGFKISDKAFKDCSNLAGISLPNTLEEIGTSSFENCYSLQNVVLPASLTKLGDYAFKGCSSISKLELPKSLEALGSYDGTDSTSITCFDGCSYIKLTVAEGNNSFVSNNGILYLKEDGVARILCYAPQSTSGDVVIPKTVNKIVNNAFYNCLNYYGGYTGNTKIKSVSFEDNKSAVSIVNGEEVEGVLVVGKSAFNSCTGLCSASLPNITVVEESLFAGCKNLLSFEVPNTVTAIKEKAFYQCGSAYNSYYGSDTDSKDFALTFEAGNEELGLVIEDASSNYSSPFYAAKIKNLVLPKRLTKIGNSAFFYCTKLESITIPSTVTTIGNYAFQSNSSLKNVTFEENSTLTTIGNSVFSYCSSLSSISLPDSVESIGSSAFQSAKITSFKLPKGVSVIPVSCFKSCNKLTSFDFGSANIKTISSSAFQSCSALTEITIPSTVTAIESQAFSSSGLTNINFADNCKLTAIGNSAFASTKITAFAFPTVYDSNEKVQVISLGSKLFDSCYDLESVKLSPSINEMSDVLSGVSVLKTVDVSENDYFTVDTVNSILYSKDKTKLYCSFNSEFMGELVIPEGVESIYPGAFENKMEITSVSFPKSLNEIGSNAFSGCSSLETVTFADDCNLASVGDCTFTNCVSLTSVALPSNLQTISYEMFMGCEALTSVTSNATYIASEAFLGCSQLTGVTYSKGLTYIGDQSFAYCASLKSINLYKNTVLGYSPFDSCFNLSEVYIEEGFKAIVDDAFRSCSSLKSITLPNSLESIGMNAFAGTKLTELVIPKNVSYIADNAFSGLTTLTKVEIQSPLNEIGNSVFKGCSSLESIILPNSLSSIGEQAFYGCVSLKSIDLPSIIESIGGAAFYGCSSLTAIVLPENLVELGSSSGYYYDSTSSVFGNCTKLESVEFKCLNLTRLEDSIFSGCKALTSIELPGSITYIGSQAFSGTGLVEANIAGVTELGTGVFKNCKSLTTVYLNDSLGVLPASTFAGCTAYTDAVLPIGVTKLGDNAFDNSGITNVSLDNIEVIGANVFANCSSLTSFIVKSDSLKSIPTGMFNGCTNLTTVELPDALESIGSGAFAGTGVTSFRVPAGLIELADNAFANCESLSSVDFSSNNSLVTLGASAFEGCKLLTTVNLPTTVEEIGAYAFKNSGLTGNFVINEKVDSIGNNPFAGCQNVNLVVDSKNTKYHLDSTESLYSSKGDLVVVNSSLTGEFVVKDEINVLADAFYGCNGITKLTLSEGITQVTSHQFDNVGSITELALPSSLTKIESYGFANNAYLTSVVLPKGVEVDDYVFANCTSLESVKLSKGIKISNYMFSECSKLTNVEFIGEATEEKTTIGDYAFYNCSSLSNFVFDSSISKLGDYSFSGCGFTELTFKDINLYYAYTTGVFANNTKLKTVTFEEESSFGEYCIGFFSDCTALETFNVPSTFDTLGSNTFSGCSSLKTVEIPASMSSLGGSPFANSGITSIVIPESITYLDDNAFYNCTMLEKVVIEGKLEYIGYDAFSGCTAIKKLVIDSENLYGENGGIASGAFSNWTSEQTICFTSSEAAMASKVDSYAFENCEANIVYNYKETN